MILGKVIEVSNTLITVALNSDITTSYVIKNGISTRVGGVNNFVKVENEVYEIINEKTTLDLDKNASVSSLQSKKILSCRMIGYFSQEKEFVLGSSGNTPNIFDNVYTLSNLDLFQIYCGTNQQDSISVGKYLNKIDLDFLLVIR